MWRNPRVAHIFTRQIAGDFDRLRQDRRQILRRVHGGVDVALQQGMVKLLGKKPLPPASLNGTLRIKSPLVLIVMISIASASRPCAAMRRPMSSRVWASAKGLPRVPSLKGRALPGREVEGIVAFPMVWLVL